MWAKVYVKITFNQKSSTLLPLEVSLEASDVQWCDIASHKSDRCCTEISSLELIFPLIALRE